MNIAAIAAAGVDKAWATIASELTAVTLRDGPTTSYDATTDITSPTTWAASVALDVFFWDDKKKENEPAKDGPVTARNRMALIRRSDCPTITEITAKAELLEGAVVWKVTHTDTPPGGAIFILTLRQ